MTLADLVPRGARQIVPGLPIPPTLADPSAATAAATTVTAAD